MTWYNGSYQIKNSQRTVKTRKYTFIHVASTLKKNIWYDEIYKYMILGKGVHLNPQSVKGYILDIWFLSLLYFI